MNIFEKMKNPPMDYRPSNYWGWMSPIEPEEVRWQVDSMVKAGFGGCVMHARAPILLSA